MRKFKVGDRVTSLIPFCRKNSTELYYPHGTIKELALSKDRCYAVEFDDDIDGITCCGACKEGHGFWVHGVNLKKEEQ